MLALRFYATGAFQSVAAELVGVSQQTAGRTVSRVTKAILRLMPKWVKLPCQEEADVTKTKFYQMGGFPNVIGCVDGTHVRIISSNRKRARVRQPQEFSLYQRAGNHECITVRTKSI